ncbi:tetratricopeptide repeat protein [uncultured Roseibium sp.]|uniref:tetratricopeptide repeat protein n=1 Tax=uncultured Roseibium sp. TaxID=1936171 RepID=UPI003217207F
MARHQVLRQTPTNPVVASLQKAIALQSSGKLEKAMRIYKSVLKKHPRNADANHLLGVTYRQLGYPKRAIEYIEKAIQFSPDKAPFFTNLARAQADLPESSLEEVLQNAEKAIRLDAGQVEAINLKAITLFKMGRISEAERIFRKLQADFPNYLEGYRNLGKLLMEKEEHEQALYIFEKLVQKEPDNAEHRAALIRCKLTLEDYDTVETELADALKRFPDDGGIKHQAAKFLYINRRPYEAVPYAEDAVSADPKDPSRLITLGVCYLDVRRREDALQSLLLAKRLVGRENPEIDWNLSLTYMALGDFEKGWDLHPARLAFKRTGGVMNREFDVPLWDGGELTDKTIMVWQDQGIGDTIISGIMLHDLLERGGRIIYEGPPKTVKLFQRAFPDIECRGTKILSKSDDPSVEPDYDCQIAISDLGGHFRRSREAYAKARRPSFKFDREQALGFLKRLKDRADGPIVGVSWRSQNLAISRMRSYLSAPDFCPVMAFDGVTYVNLQYVSVEKELRYLEEHTNGNFIDFPDVDLFDDLDSAMSLSAICDFVVAANTSASVLPAVLDIPVLSWGAPYLMPLLEGKYILSQPSTHYCEIDERLPTKEIVPVLKEELGKLLQTFSPEARNRRLGL